MDLKLRTNYHLAQMLFADSNSYNHYFEDLITKYFITIKNDSIYLKSTDDDYINSRFSLYKGKVFPI